MQQRLPTKELLIEQNSHKSTVLNSNRSFTGQSSMVSKYNFRQLVISPSQVQQQPVFIIGPGIMHKGYQMIGDSAVLRTDEDEITSQTNLMGANQVAQQ